MIQELFFELIRVAIGRQGRLSHSPSASEWRILCDMAERQSLLGVCFAGIKKLERQEQQPPIELYYQWLAVATQIQEQNERMNAACIEVQGMLKDKRFNCCILKGQAVASYYPESRRMLRQPGDIDVWVWKEGHTTNDTKRQLVDLAKSFSPDAAGAEHHVGMEWNGHDVELHYKPAYMCNPWTNKRFQQWAIGRRNDCVKDEKTGIVKPSAEFDVIFLLAHAFRHYMSEGVGLRQVMDYHMLICNSQLTPQAYDVMLKKLGLYKFATAMIWVLGEVFKLETEKMIVEQDEKLGKILLEHIMDGGNFGHHRTYNIASKHTHIGRFLNQTVHDLRLVRHYPQEALWAPVSMVWEFLRIRL